MGTEVAIARERLTERELQILDHLEQAQGLDVPLTEYASACGLDVKDLYNGKAQLVKKALLPSGTLAPDRSDFVPVWVSSSRSGSMCRLTHPSGWVRRSPPNMLRQWSKLRPFLEHPQIPLDTNRVENAIRPFVIGRRNWLFSQTTAGATASGCPYRWSKRLAPMASSRMRISRASLPNSPRPPAPITSNPSCRGTSRSLPNLYATRRRAAGSAM
jgi:hypothetical protein